MNGYEYIELFLENEEINFTEVSDFLRIDYLRNTYLLRRSNPCSLFIVCYSLEDSSLQLLDFLKICNALNIKSYYMKYVITGKNLLCCLDIEEKIQRLVEEDGPDEMDVFFHVLLEERADVLKTIKNYILTGSVD